jgi:hypothetical protein
MIRIFNIKLDVDILIDESVDWIQFNPRHYEEKPYVILEMNEFHFPSHANKCSNCKKFLDSFGKESVDWYISYSKNTYRLDTKQIGQKGHPENQITVTMSDYNPGTKLTLVFHDIPTDETELNTLLTNAVDKEDYENACVFRDLINEKN